jgi:hypothetical protein
MGTTMETVSGRVAVVTGARGDSRVAGGSGVVVT